jgi:hypothetical protein
MGAITSKTICLQSGQRDSPYSVTFTFLTDETVDEGGTGQEPNGPRRTPARRAKQVNRVTTATTNTTRRRAVALGC